MSMIRGMLQGLLLRLRAARARRALTRQWEAMEPTIDPEQRTYYPDAPRKSREEVLQDLRARYMDIKTRDWTLEMTVENYFMYGLDRKEVDAGSFVHNFEYDRARNACQPQIAHLLKNKEKAAVYFRACGVRVSCPAGSVGHGEFTAVDYTFHMPLEEWLRTQAGKRYFVKPRGGRQALGCFRLVVGSGESPCMVNGEPAGEQDVVRMCEGCLIEPLLVQHEQLRRISPHAVFPIRIRTTRRGDSGPQFLSAYMAVGWKHSYCTNICNGNGIAFAVDEHGYGISDGLMEPDGKGGRGMRMAQHPETGDTFKGYHVPMMEEAIELAIKAHSTLPEIHSIGWDVGILDDGPIIIEGNAEWGTVSYQALMGKGEREYFEKWVKPFPCKNPTHTTYGV